MESSGFTLPLFSRGLIIDSCTLALSSFLLAFFWLSQDVRVSATGYDIGRLEVAHTRTDARIQDLLADLNRLGREPAIRKQGIDSGLGQLSEPIVLPAR